ncbi:Hypothetical protein PHPALM_4270 [Phytophthora palmivora]|uniref:Uncharacterized protein n=1 Tax=Phytophthora palmivora TaxID=4796 RepID=A0A2P4YK68_9STRA|nr:Hypothetical protein PHPALM_4270 [Phytophthora palmivora]
MTQLLADDCTENYEVIERETTARDRTAASLVRDDAMSAPGVVPATTSDGHCLEENPDMVDNDQGLKHRQHSCKVCALYKSKPRKYTKYFSPECSTGSNR